MKLKTSSMTSYESWLTKTRQLKKRRDDELEEAMEEDVVTVLNEFVVHLTKLIYKL